MSSILKREVFFDNTGGIARFWDWALTTTTLGSMAEPFNVNDRFKGDGVSEYDPTDDMTRIDEIRASSVDTQAKVLSGGDHALIGGPLNPRNNSR
jgi:hypothetical protein